MKTTKSNYNLTIVFVSPSDNAPGDATFLAWLKYLEERQLKFRFFPLSQDSLPGTLKTLQEESVYIHFPDITYILSLKDALQTLKTNGNLLIAGCDSDMVPFLHETLEAYDAIDAIVCTPEIGDVLIRFRDKTMEDIDFGHIPGIAFRKPGSENGFVVNNNPPSPENINHLSSLESFNYSPQLEVLRISRFILQGTRLHR